MSNSIIFKFCSKHCESASPLCILHTRTGCVPHLTNETMGYLKSKIVPFVYEVPVSSVIDHVETLKECASPSAECFALPSKSLIYASIRDHSLMLNRGYNTNKYVGLWGIGGKISVTSEIYMNVIDSLKPDLYEVLSDGDVSGSDVRKRAIKSVDRSAKFLNECLKIHKENPNLKDSKILCVVEGGMWLEERKRSVRLIEEALKQHEMEAWGYVVDALPEAKLLSEQTRTIVESTINLLPLNKPMLVHGFGHPLAVVDLFCCGVSLFDASFITALSEKNSALVYKVPIIDKMHSGSDILPNEDELQEQHFQDTINVLDKCHANSFIPLVENCQCYTCTHHTRAYLHHLALVNEMLGPVLLSLHNLHHHLTFFDKLKCWLDNHNDIQLFRKQLLALNISKTSS